MGQPVYLVRHGQSEWNAHRLVQGQTSHPPLTALGRAQARRAAHLIRADAGTGNVAIVISSDLVRAVQTAEILAAATGAPIVLEPRLRERHLGLAQGRSYEEASLLLDTWSGSPRWRPRGGGETPAAVVDRMAAVVDDDSHRGARVLVSHGDAITLLVQHLGGPGPRAGAAVEVGNGAVARVNETVTWLG